MSYLNYEYFNPHAGPGGFALAGSAIHIWSASGQHRPDCYYPGFPCRRKKATLHIRLGYLLEMVLPTPLILFLF